MKKQILIGIIMFILNNNNLVMAQIEDAGMYKSGIENNPQNQICSGIPKEAIISCNFTAKKDWLPGKYILYAKNLSTEIGIIYQWQVLTVENQTWKDIPNENQTTYVIIANNKSYIGNYYRLKSICLKDKTSNYSNLILIL